MFNVIRRAFKGPKRKRSVEDELKRYLGFSEGLIALGFFGYAIKGKLNFELYFDGRPFALERLNDPDVWQNALRFLQGEWFNLLFAIFVIGWFFLYRAAVKNELIILSDLYSKANPPKDWERMIGLNVVPLLALGLTIAFVGLAWTIDRLEIFCIIMLVLSIQDAYGNNTLRRNIVDHFLRPQFDPAPDDPVAPLVLERRKIALEYWVWKPQLSRIGLMMIGTIAAFLAATSEDVFDVYVGSYTPQIIIIFIICANEITMDRWRVERDRALERIEARQGIADAAQAPDGAG